MTVRYAHNAGAALVVSLVLLLIMTVLGVSGMATAALELVMSGNRQYARAAFQAAETGLQRRLFAGSFVPGSAPQTLSGATATGDTFQVTTRYVHTTAAPPGLAGSSRAHWSARGYRAHHFELVSLGRSRRNGLARHTLGIYLLEAGPDSPDSGDRGCGLSDCESADDYMEPPPYVRSYWRHSDTE